MEKLRDYVLRMSSWFTATRETMRAQAEFARFLRSMGAEDKVDHEELDDAIPPPMAPPRDFWNVTDDEIISAIRKTARSLKEQKGELLGHPANKLESSKESAAKEEAPDGEGACLT